MRKVIIYLRADKKAHQELTLGKEFKGSIRDLVYSIQRGHRIPDFGFKEIKI